MSHLTSADAILDALLSVFASCEIKEESQDEGEEGNEGGEGNAGGEDGGHVSGNYIGNRENEGEASPDHCEKLSFSSREDAAAHIQSSLRRVLEEHASLSAATAPVRLLPAVTSSHAGGKCPWSGSILISDDCSPSMSSMMRQWGRRHNPANDSSSSGYAQDDRPQALSTAGGMLGESRSSSSKGIAMQKEFSEAECMRWVEEYRAHLEAGEKDSGSKSEGDKQE